MAIWRGEGAHLFEPRRKTVALRVARAVSQLTPGQGSLPDYIIIGEKRCGTTSLQRYLLQHPQVRGPLAAKGSHYFDLHYERGEEWYRSFFPSASKRAGQQRLIGESSPYYFFHPLAAQRISEVVPKAKLIVLLREPAQRAWSHYLYEKAKGTEPLSFQDAIAQESIRLAGVEEQLIHDPTLISKNHRAYSYVARSHYSRSLSRLFQHIDRDQVFIVRSETMYEDPHPALSGVHEFLGLDEFTTPDIGIGRRNRPSESDFSELAAVRELLADDQNRLEQFLGQRLWD